MPTYEYGCSACGHQWEKEQRISENPIRKCPSCGKAKAQRLISGGNFILKGDGWYADLYHKPAAKKSTGEGKSEGAESKSADAKSEAKGEAKADTPTKPDKPAKADKAKGKAA